jgi:Ca2+-binding EF-hand superfamily protein
MSKSKVTSQPPKSAPKAGSGSWKDRISEQDYEELKATFDLFDEDRGGTIDPVEVEKILDELGLKGRSSIVFDLINGLRDLNRPINFEEFLSIICSKVGDLKSRDGVSKVFELWDREGNGYADFDSFKRIARELGETLNDDELIELMHNAYILNGTESHDNFNFEEFYTIVTKKR